MVRHRGVTSRSPVTAKATDAVLSSQLNFHTSCSQPSTKHQDLTGIEFMILTPSHLIESLDILPNFKLCNGNTVVVSRNAVLFAHIIRILC